MLKFHEHRGHRFCEDTDEGTFWCSTVEGEPWDAQGKIMKAIDHHADQPSIAYQVYLGETESHQYTIHARCIFELLRYICERWCWKDVTWKTVEVDQGYPSGSLKYLACRPPTRFGADITRVLIIPPRT